MALPGSTPPDPQPGAPPSASADLLGGDWPRQATEQVVSVVDQVRAKTTGPILQGSRAVVYGLVVAATATVAGLLGLIGFLRLVNLVTNRPSVTYLITGVLFLVIGAVLWSKREARAPKGATPETA